MFICKWEPMDINGNSEFPDIDWGSYLLGFVSGIIFSGLVYFIITPIIEYKGGF